MCRFLPGIPSSTFAISENSNLACMIAWLISYILSKGVTHIRRPVKKIQSFAEKIALFAHRVQSVDKALPFNIICLGLERDRRNIFGFIESRNRTSSWSFYYMVICFVIAFFDRLCAQIKLPIKLSKGRISDEPNQIHSNSMALKFTLCSRIGYWTK
jgi:hypothetical protein